MLKSLTIQNMYPSLCIDAEGRQGRSNYVAKRKTHIIMATNCVAVQFQCNKQSIAVSSVANNYIILCIAYSGHVQTMSLL